MHVYLVKLLGNNSGIFQYIELAAFSVHSREIMYSFQIIGEFLKTKFVCRNRRVLFLQLQNVIVILCIRKGDFIPNELDRILLFADSLVYLQYSLSFFLSIEYMFYNVLHTQDCAGFRWGRVDFLHCS